MVLNSRYVGKGGVVFPLTEQVDTRFLFPVAPLLFCAFYRLGEDLLFLEGGIISSFIGDDLLLKLLHLLFQENLSCENVPKSVLVPIIEILLLNFHMLS